MNGKLLSRRGIEKFLDEFWENKPCLARNVLTSLDTAIDRDTLFSLACHEDVESRLVLRAGRRWEVRHGPFHRRDFARLPARNWTLLVNGVENFVPAARALQMRFSFIPYARHDDVMVSYAVPGGGVGPHYDSYDVFLIQAQGQRRWQISTQRDLTLVQNAPLKLLRSFRPRQEWTLRSGDILYLPPNCAHHGVARDECITWSVGMRTPSAREIAARFLDYLQDAVEVKGEYRDRGLKRQRQPSAISAPLLAWTRAMTKQIRWRPDDVTRCIGEYMSEPRPNVIFKPRADLTAAKFDRLAATRGVRLSIKSRMLMHGSMAFLNGESVDAGSTQRSVLRALANDRALPPHTSYAPGARALLYQWYLAGYIELGNAAAAPQELMAQRSSNRSRR